MGVSIHSKNSKYSFYMGGGGFFNLRKNIAYAIHPVLGDLYSEILKTHTSEGYEDLDRRTTEFLATTDIESKYKDVLDFLYASDISGQIKYTTCKKIYDLIVNVDFGGKRFQYVTFSNGNDYEDFKLFLRDCYKRRCSMRWG